jgi:hypothetical protein
MISLKNILTLSFLALLVLLGAPHLAKAQETASDNSPSNIGTSTQSLPEILVRNLELTKLSYLAGETVNGSFELWNMGTQAVPSVFYSISLASGYDVANVPSDIYKSSPSTTVFLSPGEHKKISFSYTLPKVGGDDLGIHISTLLPGEIHRGWADQQIKVIGGIEQLSVTSASFAVGTTTYALEAGPIVYKGDIPSLSIELSNATNAPIKSKPVLALYSKASTPNKLPVANDKGPFTIQPGETNAVTIVLPTFNDTPGVYYGTISFVDNTDNPRTQSIPFRYIVDGTIVNIISINADKTSGGKNDVVNLTLDYSGTPFDINTGSVATSAVDPTLDIKLYNEAGSLVGLYSNTHNFNAGKQLQAPITLRTAVSALRVEATVSLNDKTLATFESNLSANFTDLQDQAQNTAQKNLVFWIIIIILIIILMTGIIWYWKKKKNVPIAIVIIAVCIGLVGIFFYSNQKVLANNVGEPVLGWKVTKSSGWIYTTVNSPQTIVSPGQPFYITLDILAYGCSNTPQDVTFNLEVPTATGITKINPPAFRRDATGGHSKYFSSLTPSFGATNETQTTTAYTCPSGWTLEDANMCLSPIIETITESKTETKNTHAKVTPTKATQQIESSRQTQPATKTTNTSHIPTSQFIAPEIPGVYKIHIKILDNANNSWGSSSQEGDFVFKVVSPITAPEDVSSTCSPEGGAIVANWDTVSGYDTYHVIATDTTTDETVFDGRVTGSTYTVNPTLSGHTYGFSVSTVDTTTGLESDKSQTTPMSCNGGVTPPNISTSGGSSVACGGNVELTWNPVPGATSYVLYRDNNQTPIYSGSTTSFTDSNLSSSNAHQYTGRSYTGIQFSDISNTISATATDMCPNTVNNEPPVPDVPPDQGTVGTPTNTSTTTKPRFFEF